MNENEILFTTQMLMTHNCITIKKWLHFKTPNKEEIVTTAVEGWTQEHGRGGRIQQKGRLDSLQRQTDMYKQETGKQDMQSEQLESKHNQRQTKDKAKTRT